MSKRISNATSTTGDRDSTIRLDDFLKLMGMVATGGEAKIRIQSGEVIVNGQVETRRRRQLVPGDVVESMGHRLELSVESDDDDPS